MKFRHFFIKNKFLDRIYINYLRPFCYLVFIYPIERINLFHFKRKYNYLKKYNGIYKNQRCFILGTGPSLKKQDVDLIKDEILIGVNGICLWKEYLNYVQYFFVSDILAYRRLKKNLPFNTFVSSDLVKHFCNTCV
jgi:hypothetical protein